MDLNKLDRIELSMKDIEKVSNWFAFHHKEGEMINFPLSEGLVVITDNFYDGLNLERFNMDIPYNEIIIHFKAHEGIFNASFDMYIQERAIPDEAPMLSWELDKDFFDSGKFKWKSGFKRAVLPDHLAQEQAKHHTRLTLEILTYMVNVTENVIEKKVTRTVKKKAKAKKGLNAKKRSVKISVTKYQFDFEGGGEESRKYDRHTLAWTVRGHWRYYKKTGKRVWVKGYVKGDADNVEGKIYKV